MRLFFILALTATLLANDFLENNDLSTSGNNSNETHSIFCRLTPTHRLEFRVVYSQEAILP